MNCSSPERICRGLVVLWEKPFAIEEMEVVIVNQSLDTDPSPSPRRLRAEKGDPAVKRLLCTLLACALALGGLAGCGSIFDRRYSSVTTHQEQAATEEDSSILRAENYTDLVSCVQHFVSLGQSTGTVQVYKYSGDIASDLEAACNEVCTEDPLGAYALYGISYDYSRIISYYECTFTFSYRRSAEDIAAIVSAYGNGTIRDLIQEKLSAFSPSLAIRTSSFYSDSSNLYTLVQEAYYTAPAPPWAIPRYPSPSIPTAATLGLWSFRLPMATARRSWPSGPRQRRRPPLVW